MGLIVRLLINTIAVYITAVILKAGITVPDLATALIVAITLGIVNTVLKPILVLLTLPMNILSLGLFTFVINAALIMFVGYLVPGFQVASFWWALLFSLVLSIISSLLDHAS